MILHPAPAEEMAAPQRPRAPRPASPAPERFSAMVERESSEPARPDRTRAGQRAERKPEAKTRSEAAEQPREETTDEARPDEAGAADAPAPETEAATGAETAEPRLESPLPGEMPPEQMAIGDGEAVPMATPLPAAPAGEDAAVAPSVQPPTAVVSGEAPDMAGAAVPAMQAAALAGETGPLPAAPSPDTKTEGRSPRPLASVPATPPAPALTPVAATEPETSGEPSLDAADMTAKPGEKPAGAETSPKPAASFAQAMQDAARPPSPQPGNAADPGADLGRIEAPQQNAAPAAQRAVAHAYPTHAAVPAEAVAIDVARFARQGLTRFEIRLDPAELGRVEVQIDVGRDGNARTRLVVERTETLDLLMRDARALERALNSAGLKTDEGGVQFSLSDRGSGGRSAGGETAQRVFAQYPGDGETSTEPAPLPREFIRLGRLARPLDLTV